MDLPKIKGVRIVLSSPSHYSDRVYVNIDLRYRFRSDNRDVNWVLGKTPNEHLL